ncbi:hypothetical protein R3W88_028785 [Solanum pinnatisectum]|uniref:F-box domain-containing protein n=1 Tax=Solanum pinnatisectum TaxID=50273 RepID=A0AAV9K3F3_9SOLN|nr:hypothetical protein R3W88_028785 [Solanum pinnatisectum]
MVQKRKNYGKLPNSFASKKHKKKQKAKKLVDQATNHFPEEILVEILNRLPVRSFVRFKCVFKFCTTLISDPYFIRKHLNHAKNDEDSQKLLINQCCPKDNRYSIYCCPSSPVQLVEDVEKLKLDCPSIPKPRCCIIHCCYDGLAVIQICYNDRVIFLLWNPFIRESIVLPALGYPQDEMFSHFGLGYDSINDEYKILHMPGNQGNSKYPNEILALKSGLWRRIDEHPLGNLNMQYLSFIHAAFHWIVVSRNYFVVVSFSISNEVYREISLSEEILNMRPSSGGIGLSVLGGMLCVHSNSILMGKTTFKAMEWKYLSKSAVGYLYGLLFNANAFPNLGQY